MKALKKILGGILMGILFVLFAIIVFGGNMAFVETCRGLDGQALEKRITAIEERLVDKTDTVLVDTTILLIDTTITRRLR